MNQHVDMDEIVNPNACAQTDDNYLRQCKKNIESHMFTTNGINKSIVQSLLCHRIPANQLRVEVNVIL